MKTKLVPLLGIAFAVALVATGVFYGLIVGKLRVSAPPRYTVVVASRPLSPGTVLQASDLKLSAIEAAEAPKGSFAAPEHAVGFTVLDGIAENSPIVEQHLASQRSIKEGMRAISVHVADSSGIVAMLHPGHKVDVQVVGSAKGEMSLRTVLQNIEVLSTSGPDNGRPVVNLLVAPDEGDVLGLADSSARVRLVLRNPSDEGRPLQNIIPASTLLQRTQSAPKPALVPKTETKSSTPAISAAIPSR
jgi:Flp pilus assembly protein CpaB